MIIHHSKISSKIVLLTSSFILTFCSSLLTVRLSTHLNLFKLLSNPQILIAIIFVSLVTSLTVLIISHWLLLKPIRNLQESFKLATLTRKTSHFQVTGIGELDILTANLTKLLNHTYKQEDEINSLNNHLKVLNQMFRHDVANRLVYTLGLIDNYQLTHPIVDEKTIQVLSKLTTNTQHTISYLKILKSLETNAFDKTKLYSKSLKTVIQTVAADQTDLTFHSQGDAKVLVDEAIISVIGNITHNALIHADVRDVYLKITKGKRYSTLTISDKGKGIPDKAKTNLFTKGFYFGPTGHSGIGLYLVKNTMDRYGGSVSVSNNQPQGTTFTLKFKSA